MIAQSYNEMCVCEYNGQVWVGIGDADQGPVAWHAIDPDVAPHVARSFTDAARAARRPVPRGRSMVS